MIGGRFPVVYGAQHPDMPESAVASGCIDFILSPEEISKKLVSIVGG
jgi:chemotaxis response regulator CheB